MQLIKQNRIFYYGHLVTDMFDINGDDTDNLAEVTTVVVVLPNNEFDAWESRP